MRETSDKSDLTARQIPAELAYEALLSKSRLFAKRGLVAKDNDPDLVQLCASLALELLAKASLAKIHPSLIVEPDNPNSLLEANGIHTGMRIRTISARTLYADEMGEPPSVDVQEAESFSTPIDTSARAAGAVTGTLRTKRSDGRKGRVDDSR